MSDFPKAIRIVEQGPREGFQFEKQPVPTVAKVELIDALSGTGLSQIQTVSFVNPKMVPQMADAEAVVAGITPKPGVRYTALALNEAGIRRALATGRLDLEGFVSLTASEAFLLRNQRQTMAESIEKQRGAVGLYKAHGIDVNRVSIMAAFGCNFEGDIPVERVLDLVQAGIDIAAGHGSRIRQLNLSDTMGWATPRTIRQVLEKVRARFPDLELALHLHDTRGMGIANAYAGLEMGVSTFDSCVGGLGGCPFAGNPAAAGNVCTEDLVFLCDELGIETGVSAEAMIEAARLAERIVGHPLPGSVKTGGTLARRRAAIAANKGVGQ
ncbi:hydroxymethylglutaryl-CoA lyase [Pigmentiphaga soli]|uniref:Hydroxymethylglutaryl-CoA lyase n=1 Tax=Pigmentiphaga soli TaxID=1007095 RepID=A0ABP8HNT0_9BURK